MAGRWGVKGLWFPLDVATADYGIRIGMPSFHI